MSTLTRVLVVALAVASCVPFARAQGRASGEQPKGLDQVVDRLDLRDIALSDALRALGEESGVNLVASEEASAKKVSCYLQGVTVRQAIESVSKAYGLWYREDDAGGIVRVLTAQEFERDLSTFRDERTAVFTLNYPNSVDVAYAIRNLYGDRVRLSVDREYRNDEYDEMQQRFQRFDLLDRRAQSLGVFGGNSGVNGSGFYNGNDNSNDNRFSNTNQQARTYANDAGYRADDTTSTTPSNEAKLSADQLESLQRAAAEGRELDPLLLSKLRGQQTSIFVTIVRRNNMIAVRSSDRAAIGEIEKLVQALDVPTPQVLLEVKILNLDLGDDFDSAFDSAFQDQHTTVVSGGTVPSSGDLLSGGLLYQYVNDTFAARIQFLQERRRISTLATPMLLVANNEVARLFIGEERPLVRNVSTQVTQNNNSTVVSPNTTVELRPVGTTLMLTPNVNADRTVTLRVLQENSEINANGASIPIITGDGTVTNQPIDTVRSRTVTGTVVAKDGLTLALGGLVEEGISDGQSGIPGLMDLPLVGALFRRETKSRKHNELVVLVRPHVLFTAPEGEAMSRDIAGRVSIHPSASSLGGPLNAYDADEAPRAPLTKRPLKEMLKFQSGLPDGQ